MEAVSLRQGNRKDWKPAIIFCTNVADMEDKIQVSDVAFTPRPSNPDIEKGLGFSPKFDANGLIAALAMDHETREPLMLAYMNEESLKMTLAIGEAVYYSRSRQEIWHKGATSGHVQKIKQILVDCDQDALILLVDQCGAGACHTGHRSCFFRSVPFGGKLVPGSPVELEKADDGPCFDSEAVYGKKH